MENHQPPQYVPPGHYCSPIPSIEDIERALTAAPASYSGIDLREDQQLDLLEKLSRYYAEIPFPAEKNERFRFAFHNPSYSWGDAIILFCMIRELKPRRILEIGSGHTSALILDTNERYFGGGIDCTFVEPYPELLISLLRPNEGHEPRLISRKLQDVDLTLFDTLEYPPEWLREGRGWNEQYALRAFLQFNGEFRIKLFTAYLIARHREWFEKHMPNCLLNAGGQIWIERAIATRTM